MCNLAFCDKITQLCFEHFEKLPKSGKPNKSEWTILSCIVLEDAKNLEVVALGTGTKCIGHDKMSKDGDILNDSHAEIICRRAFLRYIYENILEENIFTFDKDKQTFTTKEDIKFHFFTTQVPCGDAAIFPKQDSDNFGDLICKESLDFPQLKRCGSPVLTNENKKLKSQDNKDDIFRTGAKCLPTDVKQDLKLDGANFHVTGVVRTKPGRGVPTLSVSCSDKIAKWCHLGIQGSLLSLLLNKPIYFENFIICGGAPYNENALKRALFDRFQDTVLTFPYQKFKMNLCQTSLEFTYSKSNSKHPCSSSIIWLKGNHCERSLEVAVDGRRQGVTKKQLKKAGALKICKLELFKKFIEIVKHFNINLDGVNNLNKLTYKDAKLRAKAYQQNWCILKNNFNIWTTKDADLLNFCIS